MNNLREIWGQRFIYYVTELQKYMKYVFTGHLAIVFIFTIGAGGYAYSEWLKTVSGEFPAALLTAIVVGGMVVFSQPVTLLKRADAVYFLPLEKKLEQYLKRARNWTLFSQLPVPYILLIVALPLLSATGTGSKNIYIVLVIILFFLKWLFVETEFNVRYVQDGQGIWKDRLIRFLLATTMIYTLLSEHYLLLLIIAIGSVLYGMFWRQKRKGMPFPYEHFIALEQNRMLRIYRFANYFTDVPHLQGAIKRRKWLSFLMGHANFAKDDAQAFLVKRTFIRTDDTFMLWLRLTVLSALGALFIPFPMLVFVFTGALAFASAVQIIHALRGGEEFRMDMLFPIGVDARKIAITKITRVVQWIQALSVMIVAFISFGFTLTPILFGLVIVIISEATIRLTKEKEEF